MAERAPSVLARAGGRVDRGGRVATDDQNRARRLAEELLGDAAECPAEAPESARADDDLFRVAYRRRAAEDPSRRAFEHLELDAHLDLLGDRPHLVEDALAGVVALLHRADPRMSWVESDM